MSLLRLTRLPLLLVLGAALVGCDSEEADAGEGTRIEDLGSEVLYVVSEAEPFAPFEGDGEAFLERVGFVPVYPSVLPQYRLASAYIGRDPTGGEEQAFALSLQYVRDAAGSDLITVGQFMQDRLPKPATAAVPVDVGDADGWVLHHEGAETFTLAWHACDRVITIQSDTIEVEQAITMAESVQCPDAEEG